MSDIEFDILYKVILVGDPAVGKTNILSRFTKDEFMEDTRSTVGVEFSTKLFEVGDHNIKVNIWDTAGQERFRSITLSYYKGSKGAIIVFDVSRRETFDHIEKWHKDIIENTEENISCLLPNEESQENVNVEIQENLNDNDNDNDNNNNNNEIDAKENYKTLKLKLNKYVEHEKFDKGKFKKNKNENYENYENDENENYENDGIAEENESK
jgi:small GTP-binding protein